MMNLKVLRTTYTNRSTTGILSIDGQDQCFTLEPPRVADPNGNGYICIPAGTFQLTIRWSYKFNRQVPHVEEVPGRSAIEIHIGNFPKDTDGCTLVGGLQDQPDFVGRSSIAFASLMNKLYAGATLRDSNAVEADQIWDVGKIMYSGKS